MTAHQRENAANLAIFVLALSVIIVATLAGRAADKAEPRPEPCADETYTVEPTRLDTGEVVGTLVVWCNGEPRRAVGRPLTERSW